MFKTQRDQPEDEVTLDTICDKLVIYGTPESVADQLLAFQEEFGDFGTLLYAGKDWKDRELGRQSMILMAEKVMPRVDADLPAPRPPSLVPSQGKLRGPDRSYPYQALIDRPKLTLPGGKKSRLDHPQCRGMANRTCDASHSAQPADGSTVFSRRAELVVARIRHARRFLAAIEGADGPQYPDDARSTPTSAMHTRV